MQALDLPNLRDAPFRLGIDPAEAVEHGPWCRARDEVLAALANGPAHVALLGGAGSGKTLLLHALARTLQDQGRAVRVADRGGVLPKLADDVVLLLDDAEQLDAEALARLARSKGPCVVTGQPALAERLPRAFSTVTLLPLSPDDIARFVAIRLAAAGQRRDLVQPGAVLALARLSSGAARQINALAGAALFLAGLDDVAEVNQHHVREAAALRDGDAPPPSPPPPPEQSVPVEASTPEPALPPEPLSPRAPTRAPRPRLAIAVAGATLGLLVLAAAALVGQPGNKPPQPQQQATNTAPPRPSPPSAPAPQQPAPVKAPAPPQPPSEAPSPPASHEAPAPQPPANPPAPPREETAAPNPDSDSSRVNVRYRDGAAAEADHLAKALAAADPKFSHVELHAVQETPREPTIRFFYPEDVGAAWELEATLRATGDTWEVRNATRSPHKPRRGTLDVLLP